MPIQTHEVPLGSGRVSLVDELDLWPALQLSNAWRLCEGYAATTIHGTTIYLHSFVTERAGIICLNHTDHINRDKLDNRRSNLRPATSSQNAINSKLNIHNTSGHRGVYRTSSGKFQALIGYNGARLALGTFDTAEAASAACLKKRLELFGDFTCAR